MDSTCAFPCTVYTFCSNRSCILKIPFLEKHLVPYNEFGVTQRLRLGLYVLDSAAPGDALRKQPQTKYLNTALTTGKYKKIENREVSERVWKDRFCAEKKKKTLLAGGRPFRHLTHCTCQFFLIYSAVRFLPQLELQSNNTVSLVPLQRASSGWRILTASTTRAGISSTRTPQPSGIIWQEYNNGMC